MGFKRAACFAALAVTAAAIGLVSVTGCAKQSPRNELTVLVKMMPAQARFFRQEVANSFEKTNGCRINISTFTDDWDISRMLKLETGKKKTEIGLVKTPFGMTRVLVGEGYMMRLDSIVDSARVSYDMAEYHALAAGLGYVNNAPYYIPRKLETRVMFYLKSKVADAVGKFPKYKDQISAELKKYNSYGLPAGYNLEADPSQWDYFDLFTVGYIWAKEKYNDVSQGRVAHRGARYDGTALDLIERAYQLGASKDDILRMDGSKVADMFTWENVFIKSGIYSPGMWQDPWKGANIYNGVKDGKVYLAFFQQIDCFNVHGWSEDPGMSTYLPDANDMGLSVMPQAVSLAVDKTGKPVYEGTRQITTGGWWWGIPKTSPNPKLAYEFARYITSHDIQAKECSKFGMLPVRKDILNNLSLAFDEGWVGEIFKTSVDQIKLQFDQDKVVTVPLVKEYPRVAQNYVDAWYKHCVEYDEAKDGIVTSAKMKEALAKDYAAKEKEILGTDYPAAVADTTKK